MNSIYEEQLGLCEAYFRETKRKLTSWIPKELFEGVSLADRSGPASPVLLNYIMTQYLDAGELVPIEGCHKVAECLDPVSLRAALEQIYRFWLDDGAPAKRRQILVPCCLYGSDALLLEISRQAERWAKEFRGAVAASAINTIALNTGETALMLVDKLANSGERKKPRAAFAQLEKAAREAFSSMAAALGITEEALSDRAVPKLGFDESGVRIFDYGARTFTVTLAPDLALLVEDEKGKILKSLPKPGAKDDAAKAEAAKEAFAGLKKQIKTVFEAQSARLERVLRTGRQWDMDAWKSLFVQNPLMHPFALGLVWGVYQGSTLVSTFRYLEDGTLNTVDETEYTLPRDARISLAHPVELEESLLAAWKSQLEDYEIQQPIPQLSVHITPLSDKEIADKSVIRYYGKALKGSPLETAFKKYGFRDDMEGYLMREDSIGLGAFIYTEWVDWDFHGDRDGGTLSFIDLKKYDLHRNDQGARIENWTVDPRELPPRFVYSILAIFDKLVVEKEAD